MFPSLPMPWAALVDLDHPDCPHTGPLGDPEVARQRLKSAGLDIAWNAELKCFTVVCWRRINRDGLVVPVIVIQVTDPATGKAVPLSDGFLAQAIRLHRNRGTVESRYRMIQEAERDQQRQADEADAIRAEIVVKDLVDRYRDRRESIAVPALGDQT